MAEKKPDQSCCGHCTANCSIDTPQLRFFVERHSALATHLTPCRNHIGDVVEHMGKHRQPHRPRPQQKVAEIGTKQDSRHQPEWLEMQGTENHSYQPYRQMTVDSAGEQNTQHSAPEEKLFGKACGHSDNQYVHNQCHHRTVAHEQTQCCSRRILHTPCHSLQLRAKPVPVPVPVYHSLHSRHGNEQYGNRQHNADHTGGRGNTQQNSRPTAGKQRSRQSRKHKQQNILHNGSDTESGSLITRKQLCDKIYGRSSQQIADNEHTDKQHKCAAAADGHCERIGAFAPGMHLRRFIGWSHGRSFLQSRRLRGFGKCGARTVL